MQLRYDPRDDPYHERIGSRILYWLDDLGDERKGLGVWSEMPVPLLMVLRNRHVARASRWF
jgi:hypothetical protein